MTKITTIALAALVMTSGAALAGDASSAVQTMTRQDAAEYARKVAELKARGGVDTVTTGSIATADEHDARGVVVPNAEVTLGAGLAARIASMPFKPGQSFKKGQTLVLFDCARQEADLRGARAAFKKAADMHASKKRLKARGAAGSAEVREAGADAATARARVESISEELAYCTIVAPFSGRVVERHAEAHEIPAANAPVMTVVDDSALEVDLIVPSSWLRWVQRGSDFNFEVDELGNAFRARVSRLGAKVDAVSQTIKLTGVFVSRPDRVLAGMSGTARFDPPTN